MPNRIKRFQSGGETEEDLRLPDLEDEVTGRSRSYKRSERMTRLLDPTMDPITGKRNVAKYARQKIANIFPGAPLDQGVSGENALMNLMREANRISKAYHGRDYLKELQNRVMQAGTARVDKNIPYDPKTVNFSEESEYKKGGKVTRGDGIAQRGKTRGRYI